MIETTHESSATSLLGIENLIYHTPGREFELVLDRFQLSRNERIAVTGTSGAGKTTLLSLISGQLVPQYGTVRFADNDWAQLSTRDRELLRLEKIGIIFQDFELIEYLKVADNIAMTSFLGHRMSPQEIEQRTAEAADLLGISALLHRYPHQLSQGERQRVAIGRAIFTQPELILADEPTGNLDPPRALQTLNVLLELSQKLNAGMIFVTHDHKLLTHFDRTVDLNELSGLTPST